MADKFIPESDSEFLVMAKTFADGLAAHPHEWFLSAGEIELAGKVVRSFEEAYMRANDSSTRTMSAVSLKNQTRNSATQVIRQYANMIRPNAGISDQLKISIGIKPRSGILTRRSCPQSFPLLNFFGAEGGRHYLKYRDATTPDSPAKPLGAHALQLFMAISDYGAQPIRDPNLAQYVGEYGRNPITVSHEFKDGGRTATYFARWVGARNEHGPWSNPICAQVMFASSPPRNEQPEPQLKLAA
jgi:hypothetical protein